MAIFEPKLKLTISSKTNIADGIVQFVLRLPQGGCLPRFTPGSHISVRTPCGLVNKYSLSNSPLDAERYVIAVKRDSQGRGGSVSMIDLLPEGGQIDCAFPDNAFALNTENRQNIIFIAGGIGITPIYSMIQFLQETKTSRFKLYYFSRDAQSTAYLEELSDSTLKDCVTIHHDGGDPNKSFDLWPVLETPRDSRIYCCGPRFLMESVKDMTGHWPTERVVFESFGTEAKQAKNNIPFSAVLRRSGTVIQVDEKTSLLEALLANGVNVPCSCESGTCGTCKTGLVDGDVEHRDMVLDEAERQNHIMVCVSRARKGNLVLDL